MSVHVISWVLRESTAKLGDRLVLIALADHAHDDGSCAYPAVAKIASKARLSERQAQRCLRSLESEGKIAAEGVGPNGTISYRINMVEGGDNLSPGGDIYDTGGVTSTTPRGAEMSPEPSLVQPSEEQPSLNYTGGAELVPATSKGSASPVKAAVPANRPAKVGGKTVSDDEYEFATFVLMTFNQHAETRYYGKPFIEMIIRRMREHPEVTGEQHSLVIERTLARPWWDGAPSPNVIYGNAGIFEKSVHSAVMSSGSLTEEIERMADGEAS